MLKNILVANHNLLKAGGTETYTFTIIEELIKRGFNVEYFTFNKGVFSEKIELDLKVRFMSKTCYDLIIANHYTCVNYLFDRGFVIQTCHGIFPKRERPSKFANAYVAISDEVKNHLLKAGIRSEIIWNSINVARFRIEKEVNAEIKTVLSLCHSQQANELLRKVCKELDVTLIEQSKHENPVWAVEDLINKADIVVGLGRSAFEAMACGRPVIIFDHRHYYVACGDGYVKDFLLDSIKYNCSGRFLKRLYEPEEMINEFKKYNAQDSRYFREFAVEYLNIENNLDRYLKIYEDRSTKKVTPLLRLGRYLVNMWYKLFYRINYSVPK